MLFFRSNCAKSFIKIIGGEVLTCNTAGNLLLRTNNGPTGLIQSFYVNNLNELTNNTNSGKLTVVGTTTSYATNVTVNGVTASNYSDATFAATNMPLATTYTAVAHDAYGRWATNVVSVSLSNNVVFQYDANGNLTTDGLRNFAYDDENQLNQEWVAYAWYRQFVYDGKMRRRMRRDWSWNGSGWVETNEVHYICDGNLVVQERDFYNTPTVQYIRGVDLSHSLQGAGGIGGLLARKDMLLQQAAYYFSDGNGNVRSMINSSNAFVAKYVYDAYGNVLSAAGPVANANTYRFSSKEVDLNSGLVYYGYRFYDPNLQRWLNRDPIGETGGINLYGFVGNNPMRWVDPYGLDAAAAAATLGEGGGLLGEEEAAGWGAGGNFNPYVDAALAATAIGALGYAAWEYFQPSPAPPPPAATAPPQAQAPTARSPVWQRGAGLRRRCLC